VEALGLAAQAFSFKSQDANLYQILVSLYTESLERAAFGRVNVDDGDRALIDQARAGSTGAFEEIMKRYERLVYVMCFAYAESREDALDLTQNVFVKVYDNLGSFRGSGTFKAWLVRITHNEGLNWVRGRQRRGEHDELTPANAPEVEARQEVDLMHNERWSQLRRALLQLNPRQRQAVTLRYLDGTPLREIASTLGCSEGTAKNILFRSLKELRRHLAPYRRES
jgi:RNA polymerase sigma-70 factor (ECF subfamily)